LSLIGIDIGTSYIKGAILDLETCRYQHVRRVPFPDPLSFQEQSFRCEFNAQLILDAVTRMIGQLAESDPASDGIVMCTQMASLVLVDKSGTPVSHVIGWRDQRAALPYPSGGTYHDALRARLRPEERIELGNELPVGSPACFLFWLQEHGLLTHGAIPVTLADFICSSICKSPPTVDATNALAYGLFHLSRRAWHADVIERLGLDHLSWPAIVSDGATVGHAKIGGRELPCYAAVGDYQCALVGSMLQPGEISLNISTGSQVSRLTQRLEPGDYQTRPFFEGTFVNTLSHLPAGRALNILVDLLTEIPRHASCALGDPWQYIAEASAAAEDSDLSIKTSFFPGPCGSRGSIANISERNLTVGTLFRSAFRDMAANYYDCASRIWPDRSWSNLVISGGLGRKLPLLREMIRERFQSDIRICPADEDTLLGLMILGMVFRGESPSLADAAERVHATGSFA
jgi:sugar (pentulose or hexulose) kinase